MTSPNSLLYSAYYHIYNRGTNRENIFLNEGNYKYFLNLYTMHIEQVADTFAYCLLRNHFHFLVRIKSEEEINQNKIQRACKSLKDLSPSQKFSDFFNAYAKAFNRAYKRTGSLFQHPFGRVEITTDRQFWIVIAYIHLNPRKHKFVEDFREWKWSSYHSLISNKPTLLKRDVVMDWFGGKQQYAELHATWLSEGESTWFAAEDED